MLSWFKNLLKDLRDTAKDIWDPNWESRELNLRRLEQWYTESTARTKEMDEERDRKLRERDAANLSDQPRRRGK